MADIIQEISKLIDGWCERRALRPLRIILPGWPPPNGFADEWQRVWAAMRHLRAMCHEDIAQHGEEESVNHIIAELSRHLFPQEQPDAIEDTANELITTIFGKQQP